MKYLLLFAVVLVSLWWWRSYRAARRGPPSPRPPSRSGSAGVETTEIVACDLCSVHLPRSEALPGGRGVYCSDAHRRQAEG